MKNYLRFFLSAIFLFSWFNDVNAQHFKNLDTAAIPYFKTGEYGNLTTFAVDSIYGIQGATVFEFVKHLNRDSMNWDCMLKNTPGLLGPRLLVGDDSSFTFLNNRLDSIRLFPFKAEGASWNCFANTALNLKITATIEAIKDSIILGDSDRISYIKLMAQKTDGTLLPNHYLSSKTIIISKLSGPIQLLVISSFPDSSQSYGDMRLNFCGYLKKDGSEHKGLINFHNVHEYEVDDEIHEEIFQGGPSWPGDYSWGFAQEQLIKIVTGKTIYTDSICYRIYTRKWEYSRRRNPNNDKDSTFINKITIDTITVTVNTKPDNASYAYTNFDNIPGFVTPFDKTLIYSPPNLLTMNANDFDHYYDVYNSDSCWLPRFENPENYEPRIYIKGVGGPYIYVSGGRGSYHSSLLYYKKGNITWGTPLPSNVGINEVNPGKIIVMVSPNPASTSIEISRQVSEQATLSIYAIDGKEMYKEELRQANETIDVSILDNGLYFYTITSNGEASHGKLLIRH